MLNYTGTEVMYVFLKNVLQTEMADCKLFAMCSASSPCMLLQARKSMRLEVDASNMWVLAIDWKKPLTDSHWGRSAAMSLLST